MNQTTNSIWSKNPTLKFKVITLLYNSLSLITPRIPCDIFVRLGGWTEICDSREGKMKRVDESFIRNGTARDEGCNFISPKVPMNCS